MNTTELYQCLTASALARIYWELTGEDGIEFMDEAHKVYEAGVINCGKDDFDILVAEYEAEMTK